MPIPVKQLLPLVSKEGFKNIKNVAVGLLEPIQELIATRFPKAGIPFQELHKRAMVDADKAFGRLNTVFINKVHSKVSAEEFSSKIVPILEGQAKPDNPRIAEASNWTRAIYDKAWEMIDRTGVPSIRDTAYRQRYFTHSYPFEDLQKLMQPGPLKQKFITQLSKTYNVSLQEAERIANVTLNKHARLKTYGPVDFNRVLDFPDLKYRTDPGVVSEYLEGFSRRWAVAKYFGPKGELIERLSKQLPSEEQLDFLRMANLIVGPKVKSMVDDLGSPLLDRAKDNIARIYMSMSALSNASQGFFGSAIRTDTQAALKGFFKALSPTPEDTQFLTKAGIAHKTLDKAFNEFSGNARFFHNNLFTRSEEFSRSVAALAGQDYLPRVIQLAKAGNERALKEISKLGLSSSRLLKRGVTEDDLLTASIRIVHETQFRFAPESMPILAQSSLGRVLYALQMFNINQLNLVRKFILPEAREGNIGPLVKMLGLGTFAVGAGNRALWETIRGKPEEFGFFTRPPKRGEVGRQFDPYVPVKNFLYSGGLGILGDVISGEGQRNFPSVIVSLWNEVGGATFGAAKGAFKLATGQPLSERSPLGEFTPAAKFLGRRVAIPAFIAGSKLPPTATLGLTVAARTTLERMLGQQKAKEKPVKSKRKFARPEARTKRRKP